MNQQELPGYLRHWPGLFEWHDGALRDAPAADVAVARSYPSYADKGLLVNGRRLTVMSRSLLYRVAEEVRVIHVVEVVEPGQELYVMGPKKVYGEKVDETFVTPQPPGDIWAPDTYNGPVLPSPAVDYNYEITAYRFDRAGKHTVQWCIGNLRSNRLEIEVEA